MNLLSHVMFGSMIVFLLDKTGVMGVDFSMSFLIVGWLFSIAPDIDGLFAKKLSNHHNSPFHEPLFWILIIAIFTAVTRASFLSYAIVAISCVIGHIFTDFIFARTAGIKMFAPFNKRAYSLFPVNEEMGNFRPTNIMTYFRKDHIKNYMDKKLLFGLEVTINIAGLSLLMLF